MKKHSFLQIVSIILLLNPVCFLSSCNEEGIESFEVETPASTHTCRMTFDVDFTGFEAKDGTTRASIHGWDDGDVVYLSFTTPDNRTVGGSAIYDAANNDWTVTYSGTLSSTEQGSAKVYYYDGEVTKSSNTLSIEPTVGIYADLKGSYKFSRENGVNVSASLFPQTSRIRFKGDSGKTITVSGIKSYTEYDQQSGVLSTTPISSSITVSSDGYTPYIYGVFADTSKPTISINSEGCRFTKDCSSSMFKIGESGWMNVPTRAAHENWEMEEVYKAHAVLSDTDKDGVGEMLIFYYDDVDHSQEGIVFELNRYAPSWVNYAQQITNVIFDPSFVDAKPTSTYCWFFECSNLKSFSGINYLDTSEVTDMEKMFWGCSSLTSLDVSGFNTAAVKNMSHLFYGCSGLTSLDVSNFNTTAVKNMCGMFRGCLSLYSLDLRSFNTAAVKDMSHMFWGCSSLISLDLSSFDTSAVADMGAMFYVCSSLAGLDLRSFNTAAVKDMSGMFWECSSLTSLDLSNFNTSAVTDMSDMFSGCTRLTGLDVSGFNTEAVTDLSDMFSYCSSLISLDASNFDTSAVTRMYQMFFRCSSLKSLDVSSFDTSVVKDMERMFCGCSSLTSLDVSDFKTEAVTNMEGMFSGCSSLTSLDVIGFNTSAVTDMGSMFNECSSLTSLDISSFNTSAVTSMFCMFQNCSGLTSLDVGSFDTSAVTDMTQMFYGCSGLVTLDISDFDISSETNISSMFAWCNRLITIKVGNNDLSANGTNNNEFFLVGSSASPCNLVINSGFDKSVLGNYNGRYYYWRGGYFTEPTIQN